MNDHWGGGKAAQGFGADRIKTGFHSNQKLPDLMVKMLWTLAASVLIGSSLILQVTKAVKISDEFDFGPGETVHFGVTCPFSHRLMMEKMLWTK